MSLKNERYANSTLISAYGELQFDEQGIVQTDLDEQAIEALSQLKGFERVEGKAAPQAPAVEEAPAAEEAPAVEESEAKAEEAPKVEDAPKSKRGAHLNQKK